MIKANELRVGSLVYVLYQVSTITSINEFDVESHDCKDIPIEELRAIPITEEWLVKLGFVSNGINRCWKDPIDLIYMGDNSWLYLANQRHVNLFYIHQLQNLYFALTGEELTIK